LGGHLPDAELEMIAARLQAPGPWLALAHRDPCPDNVLLAADGTALLIDFEFASPGHALLDAAYWHMGFPTWWCAGRVPEPIGDRIDRAYRAVLASAVPEAADDTVFRLESTFISAAWLLGNLAWLLEGALQADTEWGIAPRRSRILHYLDIVIRMTRAADILAGLRDTAAVWHNQLQDRWPESGQLAVYPAFALP
jgi:thiamine kinase-like enzyme